MCNRKRDDIDESDDDDEKRGKNISKQNWNELIIYLEYLVLKEPPMYTI